ncbi:hypothetical protein Ddye_025769 [Dipteronia dyeriana]|uniref:Uncharacterized protein n=1 Tax=Dipteronia dyeriana TaxID=168575 RepID=A0AAD9TKV2_9ROSI|nr:hypothetical protein Ddye_025769 [Dipteronia dyeriana]
MVGEDEESGERRNEKPESTPSLVDVRIIAHKKKNDKAVNTKATETIGHNLSNESCEEVSTAPITSPNTVNVNPFNKNRKILGWIGSGEVVAEGRWSSSDPNATVHHVPVGPNAMTVWVDSV